MSRLGLLFALALAGCEWVRLPVEDGAHDADGDGFLAVDDCDDFNENVHPLAAEKCNGTDNNCSGDETDADDASTWYPDRDDDGYGDAGAPLRACDEPLGYVDNPLDCDDVAPRVHPGADELDCTDPTDYDCDGFPGAWDSDLDGSPDCEDCNDADPTVFPGAEERCNGRDDDCDGPGDEDLDVPTWYRDADGDGWGDPTITLQSCTRPSGYSADATDCDDTDASEHPSAPEACDGADNDCDGLVDEDDRFGNTRWYADLDGDGYGDGADWEASCTPVPGRLANGDDCDDADATVNPGAAETCDGLDQDCDGTADEDAVDAPTWYRDSDRDGWGIATVTSVACSQPRLYVGQAGDCDDGDRSINPGATEKCDGVDDEDCDGTVDEDGATGGTYYYVDMDGDGYGDASAPIVSCSLPAGAIVTGGDCDDADAVVHPEALEADCSDPTDYNCDGSVGRVDNDGDGWDACEDCDDADAMRSPDDVEICDALDDDCDGDVDEDAVDGVPWYGDADGDGFGDDTSLTVACTAPTGSVADGGDCDDADPAVSPGMTETCATPGDDNCDGETNLDGLGCTDWFPDEDGDGYGGSGGLCLCEAEAPYVDDDDLDCLDDDATVNPDATEVCGNGVDDDCDGYAAGCGVAGRMALVDAGATMDGDAANDMFGASIALPGDVDGDGAADVLVGAYGYDGSLGDQGGAWLFGGAFTGTIETTDALAAWAGESADDEAGYALSAGDLDGDGVIDLVVGAPYDADAGTAAGAAFVLLGPLDATGAASLASADAAYRGTDANDLAGVSVAVYEDDDGDGAGQLAVGAYRESAYSASAGRVYLFDTLAPSGSLETLASATLSGAGGGDFFGRAVASAGDVDGDGLGDLVVGAYSDDTAGASSGAAYLFLGPIRGDLTTGDADAARYGAARSDGAGLAVTGGADVDGDGYDDIAVGAFNNDTGAYNAGAAYVVYGPITGTGSLGDEAALVGQSSSDTAGTALALGDLDADGYADLAVAGDGTAWGNVGAVWVAYGPLTGVRSVADAEATLLGTSSLDVVGSALAIGGDSDGDGYGELFVGASAADGTAANSGVVYTFGGGPGL